MKPKVVGVIVRHPIEKVRPASPIDLWLDRLTVPDQELCIEIPLQSARDSTIRGAIREYQYRNPGKRFTTRCDGVCTRVYRTK